MVRTAAVLMGLMVVSGSIGSNPAAAQGISIGPGGVRVDRGYRDRDRDDLTRGEAVRIARSQGLVDVDNVARRGPRFVIDGSDRRGEDITVVVDSRTGDVVDVRR